MRRKTKKKKNGKNEGKNDDPPRRQFFFLETHTQKWKKKKKIISCFRLFIVTLDVDSLCPYLLPHLSFFFSVEIISLFPNPKYSLPRWCVNHLLSFFFLLQSHRPDIVITRSWNDEKLISNYWDPLNNNSCSFQIFWKNIFHNIPVPDRNRNRSIKCRTSWEDISCIFLLLLLFRLLLRTTNNHNPKYYLCNKEKKANKPIKRNQLPKK